jgi:hypothetical protein
LRFVLSPGIGKARSYDTISLELLERVLHFGPQLMSAVHAPAKI